MGSDKFPKYTQSMLAWFDCKSEMKAVAAGAALSISGLDFALIGAGLPPPVHWALAGYGVDAYCEGGVQTDLTKAAMCMIGGMVGGFSVQLARGVGVPFMGPLIIV